MIASKDKKVREPLFHIVKRDKIVWWKACLIRVVAIVLALVLCAFITKMLTGVKPADLFKAFLDNFIGDKDYRASHTIFENRKIWKIFQETAFLLCIGLAVTPAFKMRFWNIGAEGQVLMGCFAAYGCLRFVTDTVLRTGKDINYISTLILMLVAAVLAGAVWALIPAIFKIKWNTNETLFTLMLNYIAIQLVDYFCANKWAPEGTSNIVQASTIQTADGHTYGWLPNVFEGFFTKNYKAPQVHQYILLIFTVLVVTGLMYVYLKYSKQGYELSVVGESENTARYIGINVKKVVLRTMIISGALCGLAGFLLVSGKEHSISINTADGRGFTAIMVSWLAKFNPLVMIATAFLFVFLDEGAARFATDCGVNESFSSVLTALIIFFIIGCEFFINYKIMFRVSLNKGATK